MATKLTVDGRLVDMGKSPDLKACQEAVGGYIEGLALDPECGYPYLYMNEEGALRGLPVNPRASMMAGIVIVGDVVLLNAEEVE